MNDPLARRLPPRRRPTRDECFELFGVAVRQVMEDHYGSTAGDVGLLGADGLRRRE